VVEVVISTPEYASDLIPIKLARLEKCLPKNEEMPKDNYKIGNGQM
jgi:hypothetical protein